LVVIGVTIGRSRIALLICHYAVGLSTCKVPADVLFDV